MDISTILENMSSSTSAALWTLLWALGQLVGLLTGGFAINRLVKANLDSSKPPLTIGDIIPLLLIGACMINMSSMINSVWNTFGEGTVSFDAISYEPAAGFGTLSTTINAALTVVAVFGGIFFFKGLLLLKKGAIEGQSSNGTHGGDTIGRAITHMIGGSFLINITSILDAFYASAT
jgi:uncharacterized protein YneF (UPF0154 family)